MSYLTLIDSQKAIENAMNDLELLNALLEERRQFYESEQKDLKTWLIKGSLILDQHGGIAFFTPLEKFKDFDFPNVVEMKKIQLHVDGWTHAGGSIYTLPKEGSICPYCGKEITIEDIYFQNFHIEGSNNSFAYHSGNCHTFHHAFEDSFAVARTIILMAKRSFGEIEKICVQEGNREQDELVKISFMAYNYKIEFVVMTYNSGLTITYDNNTEQGIIYTADFYFGYDSGIEQKLNEWKDTL